MRKMGLRIVFVFFLISLYGLTGANGKPAGLDQQGSSPAAPAELKLVIVSNGFELSWKLSPQDLDIVTGHEIVRADLASGPFVRIATVAKGILHYIDTTASPETIYYYKVRAVAGTVYSPYSNTVTGER